jgi:natural product biosynthesis luciferase-like monooxygenase protein/amino acid adenylation domain-containing protein/non-ribosomal peptide synthase protein (TIGR01720 family)
MVSQPAEQRRLALARLLEARAVRPSTAPASFGQERLWLLHQLEPSANDYVIASAMRLSGPLDVSVLERALGEVIRRHAVLRTALRRVDGRLAQVISAYTPLVLPVTTAGDAELTALIDREVRRPVDLASDQPLRPLLIRRAPDDHTLLVSVHHGAADGWSMQLLVDEVIQLYAAFAEGRDSPLVPLPIQYADHAAWQRERAESGGFGDAVAFWRAELAGCPDVVALPLDRPRPAASRAGGARTPVRIDAALTARLRALARASGTTPFVVLLSAYAVLLHRWSGQDDLAIGIPTSGRLQRRTQACIGLFGNLLVARARLAGEPTFRQVLAATHQRVASGQQHAELPFERLVEELRPPRIAGIHPLFQVAFTLLPAYPLPSSVAGIRLAPVDVDPGTAKFDLTLDLVEAERHIDGWFEMRADLFDPPTRARLAARLDTLLRAIVTAPDAPIGELSIVPPEERRTLLTAAEPSSCDCPRDASIPSIVDDLARARPQALAVTYPDRADAALTYAELVAAADRLAGALVARDVEPGDIVAIRLPTGPDLVVAMLGVLKAGAAYLPLDVDHPDERCRFAVEDARARWVIGAPDDPLTTLTMADVREAAPRHPTRAPSGGDAAYLLYTSGSTGTPKGAVITHRGVVRLIVNASYLRLGRDDRMAQLSSPAFDASTWEIWGALLSGGCLVGMPREDAMRPDRLASWLARHQITAMLAVTALFHATVRARPDAFASVRLVLFGGEAADPGVVRQALHRPPQRLVHAYGPTETTVLASCHDVTAVADDATTVSIGRPVSSTTCYVVDRYGDLAPLGSPGELWVGGDGLAWGYLGRPELTAERFVPDPFGPAGGRLYRTGDRVRLREDGTLEFVGRQDQQIKLRGYRIEIGEIESVLAAHPCVGTATVVIREDRPGERLLVGYLVAAPGETIDPVSVTEHARRHLPAYMVPSCLVVLDELPLTVAGKIDRAALPAPRRDGPITLPRSAVEQVLARLWADTLGVPEVGVDDDFFALGGHSLLAAQLADRLGELLRMTVPLRRTFEARTVALLAQVLVDEEPTPGHVDRVCSLVVRITAADTAPGRALSPEQDKLLALLLDQTAPAPDRPTRRAHAGSAPLSFAQQRLWFLHQLDPTSAAYHVPLALRLTGPLRVDLLDRALAALVARHEILRTRYALDASGAPRQIIDDRPWPGLRVVEQPAAALAGLLAREAQEPFDLAGGPVLRGLLVRAGAEHHVLCLVFHHVAVDGWSTALLAAELGERYRSLIDGVEPRLTPLAVQYADFACWQRERADRAEARADLAYWRERLAGAPALLTLPTDRPHPATPAYRSGRVPVTVSDELWGHLRDLAAAARTTPFVVVLSAYAVLLGRHAEQREVVVGVPVAHRRPAELADLVGCLINTVAHRIDVGGDVTFRALLARVEDDARAGLAHQEAPFEQLVEALAIDRDLNRTPLFQTMLVYANMPAARLDLGDVVAEPIEVPVGTAKFDLELDVWEGPRGLTGWFEYRADLFDHATVERIARRFTELLAHAVRAPDLPLTRLPLIDDEERQQIVRFERGASLPIAEPCVPERIASQAARRPEAIAVTCRDVSLSYAELERRAGLVARRLRAAGARPGAIVGVCAQRSADLVVALYGVLKSGAAYLPMDPTYPADRLGYMVEDARPVAVLADADGRRAVRAGVAVLDLGDATCELGSDEPARLDTAGPAAPADLAYVIYTSGSTGRPKGVMIEHRQLRSFVAAMDERLGTDPETDDHGSIFGPRSPREAQNKDRKHPGRREPRGVTWLAVTSMSFDISVLELLWPLTHGSTVVVHGGRDEGLLPAPRPQRPLDFGLFYFASDDDADTDRYRLLLDGARFADSHGFVAVWTPERHFHSFGGRFPSPAVTATAVAMVTERVQVRAGSVVLPLHHPVRVAEEWSVIDNLSRGRVGISFASGWHSDDFVFAPGNYADRKAVMLDGIETVRRLWRGESIELPGGTGAPVTVRVRPRPIQPELPVWLTAAGNPDTFRAAARCGANVLTHLLGQDPAELAEKVAAYRQTWQECQRTGRGRVTLMLHTFVHPDARHVHEVIKQPFLQYLRGSLDLTRGLARRLGVDPAAATVTEDDLAALLDHAFERYVGDSGLFGTPEQALALLHKLSEVDIDEIACLIDFGVPTDEVLGALVHLDEVRRAARGDAQDHSLPALLDRHGVTHLQCTPSLLRALVEHPGACAALARLDTLLVGGEALDDELAARVRRLLPQTRVLNMYGPTETTIWSTIAEVAEDPMTIGRPIANTCVHVVDSAGGRAPIGVAGELLIGGPGVARGYFERPALTAERFVPDPFGPPGERLYRTGDRVAWRPDGRLAFLGRTDHQVKIRGFRVELGEIEAALRAHPAVHDCVVVARGAAAAMRLVAYLVGDQVDLDSHLRRWVPEHMMPGGFVWLDALPRTPNGKVDRAALPAWTGQPAAEWTAPRTPVEQLLAEVWSEVLGVARIGVHDNFFALGGDSLLVIRVLDRAGQRGLRVAPRLMFQRQTIAALAEALSEAGEATTAVDPSPPAGPVPMTPVQRWFFSQDFVERHHYNHAMLLQTPEPMDPALLERAAQQLVAHHDALRMRYAQAEHGWEQRSSARDEQPLVSSFVAGGADLDGWIEREAGRLQASLDLSSGPLLRVGYFDCAGLRPDRLFLVVHHLAVDGISGRVLVEDLWRAYDQLRRDQPIALPARTASFAAWASRLVARAHDPALRHDHDYWAARRWSSVAPLPRDLPGAGAGSEASERHLSVELDPDTTSQLLRRSSGLAGRGGLGALGVHEILVGSVGASLLRWSGADVFLIDVEGHGRGHLVPELDVSRTVGWFTSVYPVLVHVPRPADANQVLVATAQHLAEIPHSGETYGLLRYLSDDPAMAAAPTSSEVIVNYLGQFDTSLGPFQLATEAFGPYRSPSSRRSHPLVVNAYVAQGRLQVDWAYSTELHRPDTVAQLAETFRSAVHEAARAR